MENVPVNKRAIAAIAIAPLFNLGVNIIIIDTAPHFSSISKSFEMSYEKSYDSSYRASFLQSFSVGCEKKAAAAGNTDGSSKCSCMKNAIKDLPTEELQKIGAGNISDAVTERIRSQCVKPESTGADISANQSAPEN